MRLKTALKSKDIESVVWILLEMSLDEIACDISPAMGVPFISSAIVQLSGLHKFREKDKVKNDKSPLDVADIDGIEDLREWIEDL
tara:strand:- start:22858 stop:23112 length:255 start_codon:yes stop_codon:yes gene_type:complete